MASRYTGFSDGNLAALLSEGDELAFNEVFKRYSDVLYRHAYNKLRDTDDAKDLVQDLFAALWNQRATFSGETNLSGYLYASIRYKVINKQVRDKRIAESDVQLMAELREQADFADYRVREKELSQLIESETARLPRKMREVFFLSREEHLNHKEIAERLNLSPATVRKQVQNALRILRVKLGAFLSLIFVLFQ